jgi:protein gp37
MAMRLKAMGNPRYLAGFKVTLHPDLLDQPFRWQKPRRISVCSMSDIFHPAVPDHFIANMFSIMAQAHRHIFQILTKRPARARELKLEWPPNVWFGTTVEHSDYETRQILVAISPAKIKFVSFEPLLSSVKIADGINWVIVGGETGPGARQMKPKWLYGIYEQCCEKNIPFFFKHWGGPKKNGRLLYGQEWNEMPGAT